MRLTGLLRPERLLGLVAALVLLLVPIAEAQARPHATAAARTPAAAPAAPQAAQVFVSPTGSDASPCTRALPCASLGRAYAAAKPGQTVEIAAGTYPAQTVGADPSKQAGQPVLFRPARGASVVLASLSSNASNVQYRDLTMPNGWYVEAGGDPSQPGPTNVTFTDDHGGLFYIIGNVSNISVLGGDYGPAVDAHPMIAPANIGDLAGPVNIRVEGVNFHDFTRSGDLVHTECLQVYGGHGLVIERSRFSNCDGTGDLGIGSIGAFGLVNALVENNWFDSKGDSYFAVQTSMAAKGLVFRNNSGTRGIAVNTCDGCVGPLSLIGNYLPFAGCTAGATYSHNVFDGGKCSPTDVNVRSLDFVDPVGFDLRLKPGANAICRADPNSSPRLDYSGKARPKTRVADAGASELAMSVVPRKLAARCRTAAVAAKKQSAKAKARAKK